MFASVIMPKDSGGLIMQPLDPKVYEELLSSEEFYKDKDYLLFINRINGTSTFIPTEEPKNDRN